jgi:TrmH family RNA methyltransferase
MEITSINNQLIKDMTKLHQKKYRDQLGLFLVEGYHLYEEAQKYGVIKHIFTTNRQITGSKVIYVSETVLKKLAKMDSPQGIVTICEKVKSQAVTNKVLLIDHLQDPGNLGTLLRSALAFGFETVVLDQTVDLYNDKVLRSTQGALFQLNIINQDGVLFIQNHKDYTVYGTSMNGESISKINREGKMILILGNEGNGVREELLKITNKNVTIKMQKVESLNVGVAGSIIMHALL